MRSLNNLRLSHQINMSNTEEQMKSLDCIHAAVRLVDTKLNILLVTQGILSEQALNELHTKVYAQTMRELGRPVE